MSEIERIQDQLNKEEVRKALFKELEEVMDISTLKYSFDFLPSEYFTVDKELNGKTYIPEHHFIIEGNLDSKEIIIPHDVYRISPILRPKREQLSNYLRLLDQMNCRKVFLQPYITILGQLSLFRPAQGGGVVVRIGDVKSSSFM